MDSSDQFLRNAASKAFVPISYRVQFPGQPLQIAFASGFIVEIETHWLIVTAGHVIRYIKKVIAAGADVSIFTLHDQMAGNPYEHGVVIPFELDRWVLIENEPIEGTDYAASIIPDLMVEALRKGGIWAIEERAWGPAPYAQYKHWLLIGIPAESNSQVSESKHSVKVTLIPIEASAPPDGVEESPARVFAKIRPQPEGAITINDIAGMSGGPIFGVNVENEVTRYWVVGVQSAWYLPSRILSFCPALPFFATLKAAIKQAEKLIDEALARASESSDSSAQQSSA